MRKGRGGVGIATPVLTKQAQGVLRLASQCAHARDASFIASEHLLLALVGEGHGLAALVLRACGVSVAKLIKMMPPAQSPLAPSQQQVVPSAAYTLIRELAVDAARGLGHAYVETGHLLLGLLACTDVTAISMLEGCGTTAEQVRAETLEFLSAPDALIIERSHFAAAEQEDARRRRASSRFTASAAMVLHVAAEEAQRVGAPTVGATHLLLALAQVEGTVASTVLMHLGVDAERLRLAISNGAQRGEAGDAARTLGPSGKVAIERAVAEARRLRHRQIGPEHMVLALTAMPQGEAIELLHALGTTAPSVRALTLRLVDRRRRRSGWLLRHLAQLAAWVSVGLIVVVVIVRLLAADRSGLSDALGLLVILCVFLIIAARFALVMRVWRTSRSQ